MACTKCNCEDSVVSNSASSTGDAGGGSAESLIRWRRTLGDISGWCCDGVDVGGSSDLTDQVGFERIVAMSLLPSGGIGLLWLCDSENVRSCCLTKRPRLAGDVDGLPDKDWRRPRRQERHIIVAIEICDDCRSRWCLLRHNECCA